MGRLSAVLEIRVFVSKGADKFSKMENARLSYCDSTNNKSRVRGHCFSS